MGKHFNIDGTTAGRGTDEPRADSYALRRGDYRVGDTGVRCKPLASNRQGLGRA